jgi:hypothetical protein
MRISEGKEQVDGSLEISTFWMSFWDQVKQEKAVESAEYMAPLSKREGRENINIRKKKQTHIFIPFPALGFPYVNFSH